VQHVLVHGQHHDGRFGTGAAQFGQRIKATAALQRQVQHDDLRQHLPGLDHHLVGTRGLADDLHPVHRVQQALDAGADEGMVIADQHAQG